MDNLTHTLCGAALAKTRLGSASRLAPITLVLGANLPDADLVARLLGGKTAYLVHHRGFSHSLLGALLLALALAAAMRWVERRWCGGNARREWRAHLLPALASVLSHPLLDLLNNYGIRPWLPFSARRYFGDLVFIVDPWLWLIFGGTALLAGARTRLGHVGWALAGVAITWFVLQHERTPPHVRVALPVAAAALGVARAAGAGRERAGAALVAGGTRVGAYLTLLAWSGHVAERRAIPHFAGLEEGGATLAMRSPVLADPFHWRLAVSTDRQIRWLEVDADGRPRATEAGEHWTIRRDLDDPRVQAAAALPEAEPWRYFARLPWAWVEEGEDGAVRGGLGDAPNQVARGATWCAGEIDLPRPEQ
jgi:inner membrane protein